MRDYSNLWVNNMIEMRDKSHETEAAFPSSTLCAYQQASNDKGIR
jgi:hypothetical protein